MDIPAFPMPASEHSQGGHFEQYGMTLRDYFAAAALQGLLAGAYRNGSQQSGNQLVIDAGKIADAMIAEREKRDA